MESKMYASERTQEKMTDKDKEFLALWNKAIKDEIDTIVLFATFAYIFKMQKDTESMKRANTYIQKHSVNKVEDLSAAIERAQQKKATMRGPDSVELLDGAIAILRDMMEAAK